MADEFRVVFKHERLRAMLRQAPRKLVAALRPELVAHGRETVKRFVRKQLSGRPGVEKRSGTLQRNIFSRVVGSTLASLRVLIYPGKRAEKYFGVHETGKTIRAKRAYANVPGGPYLAIPLDAAKDSRGVSKGPRAFIGISRLLHARGDRWFVVHRVSGVPLFRLKRSVYVPPRISRRKIWAETKFLRERRFKRVMRSALVGGRR